MAKRYAIFDGKSNVITPIGEELTAEQWLNRYPWGKFTKMVIGGGIINGSCAFIFDDFVDLYKNRGLDLSNAESDEEILEMIEEFENNPPTIEEPINDQERIANALEDLVLLSELNL